MGRKDTLPCLTMHVLEKLPDSPLVNLDINVDKLAVFLNKI